MSMLSNVSCGIAGDRPMPDVVHVVFFSANDLSDARLVDKEEKELNDSLLQVEEHALVLDEAAAELMVSVADHIKACLALCDRMRSAA